MGETRPSRVNFDAPVPRMDPPKMPAEMEPAAKVVWRRVVRAMEPTGIITAADADALRVYCETMARYQRTLALLAGGSGTPLLSVSKRRGEVVRNPLYAIARDLANDIRLFGRELGLTPSARASMRVDSSVALASIDAIIGPPPRLRVVNE